MKIVTFGTFDLMHIGHINILERCKNLNGENNTVIVGISSDDFSYSKKSRYPYFNEKHRMKLLKSLKFVDEVFLEESFEKKGEYLKKYNADIFVMGDDWEGKFDEFNNICKVVYLPRTPEISTTEIINRINKN
jgi:glycerol-3-phosphate cytidylyltransferase